MFSAKVQGMDVAWSVIFVPYSCFVRETLIFVSLIYESIYFVIYGEDNTY